MPPKTLSSNNQWRLETRNYTIYSISGPGGGKYVGLTSNALEERLNWHLVQSQKKSPSNHPLQKDMAENPNGWEIKAESSVVGNYYEAREKENSVKEILKPNLNYTSTGHY